MQIARVSTAINRDGLALDSARLGRRTPTLPDLTPLPGKQTGVEVSKLVGLMQRLLAPDGCPWDREQTLATLVPYLVEETYEVVDALAAGDVDDHREELGDLLLQIVFQSELRFAEGKFGIDDVARGIVAKLVRRHPHVFGDVVAKDADAVLTNWAKLKAEEKAEKGKHGALHGIPASAPALLRATRAGEKAGAVGFDWPDADGPRAKVDEELAELDEARARPAIARRCSTSWATCCSRSPTWRAGWTWTRSRRCAARSIASRLDFVTSSWRWRPTGARSGMRPAEEQERLWQSREKAGGEVKVAAHVEVAVRLDGSPPEPRSRQDREGAPRGDVSRRARGAGRPAPSPRLRQGQGARAARCQPGVGLPRGESAARRRRAGCDRGPVVQWDIGGVDGTRLPPAAKEERDDESTGMVRSPDDDWSRWWRRWEAVAASTSKFTTRR